MKEILKYKKIKSLKQYNQYCDTLEDLIYKEDKSLKDEIELLEILIEEYDNRIQQETSKKLNPVELLKSILTDAGITQKELAAHLGVSKQLISDVLGYRRNISKPLVKKLAHFFKMTEEAFSREYDLKKERVSIAAEDAAVYQSKKKNINKLAKKVPVAKPASPKRVKAKKPSHRDSKSNFDSFRIIEGIGPRIEKILHEAGVKTWYELSTISTTKLKRILSSAGTRYKMHDPSTWSVQAKSVYGKEKIKSEKKSKA